MVAGVAPEIGATSSQAPPEVELKDRLTVAGDGVLVRERIWGRGRVPPEVNAMLKDVGEAEITGAVCDCARWGTSNGIRVRR